MKRKFHVRFLGGGDGVSHPCYPAWRTEARKIVTRRMPMKSDHLMVAIKVRRQPSPDDQFVTAGPGRDVRAGHVGYPVRPRAAAAEGGRGRRPDCARPGAAQVSQA